MFYDSHGAKRADALVHLAECFLTERTRARGSVADRYQVVVHVDQRVLACAPARSSARSSAGSWAGSWASGPGADLFADAPRRCALGDEFETERALAIETARRLGCDCSVVGIVENEEGEPLGVGRKTRSIPPWLRRALEARDGGCRYPGCDRTRYCHAHHIVHWANGGETELSNLLLVCSFHHGLIHEGYDVYRTDDGELVFTRPDGRRVEPNGKYGLRAGAAVTGKREPALFAINRERGLAIDAGTARCRWDGWPMDYSLAVQILWERRGSA